MPWYRQIRYKVKSDPQALSANVALPGVEWSDAVRLCEAMMRQAAALRPNW